MSAPQPLKVLLVEDNPDHVLLARTRLAMSRGAWDLDVAETLGAALQRLAQGGVEAVLLDLGLPDSRGVEAVERVCALFPEVPVVCLTSFADESMGMVAVRHGAQDYLVKTQVERDTLDRSLRYAIERVRADQAAARLAAIVESSEDAIVGVSPTGAVTSWNAGAAAAFGRARTEALNRPVALLAPGSVVDLGALVAHVAGGGAEPPFDLRVQRPDGSEVTLSVTASPIRIGAGRVVGVSLIARDVTERRRIAAEHERVIAELQDALGKVKTLRGLLPICASCKKVRDDSGYWTLIEEYLQQHSDAELSHGICPGCARTLYPEHFEKMYPEEA